MDLRNDSMGRASFAERFGLWSDAREDAAAQVQKLIDDQNLDVVRLAFADLHGVLRGKTLVKDQVPGAMRNGCTMTTTMLAKDTSHRTVYPAFTVGGGFGMDEMTGAGDFVMLPDPSTFRVLPWAPETGWLLCDLYFPNGAPVPFSTRQVLRDTLGKLADAGFDYVSGLEVEFHIFKLEDPKMGVEHGTQPGTPPDVSLTAHGFQYLTEQRIDELDPILRILRRDLLDLGLPLRSQEVEFGPSQVEFTFEPGAGLESADTMVLFRSAVKQICHRHGYHATFMCRPGLANVFSSGWHLHQSLRDVSTGLNAFVPEQDDAPLSPTGMRYVAGLLENARAASVFTTPTINGYKRFQPYSLAPDRAIWARDNRGVMIRALGGAGDTGTRVENRIGEPTANPYLYMASQILSGLDGINRGLDAPPSADTPYETDAPALPRSLMEALAALREDTLFRGELGDRFIDYILLVKDFEVARFLSEVTDWEHREYFEIF